MVFKKNLPIIRQSIKKQSLKAAMIEEEQSRYEKQDDEYAGLTPKEIMKLKKEKKAQEQMELMKAGAAEAKNNYQIAKQKKNEQLNADHIVLA